MKGKIFAMFAVFVMTAFVFSAIGVSALEERPSLELPSIPIPGPTNWCTALDGNAKIIGQGKPAEGTAYTDDIHTCSIPAHVYNRIAIVIGEDTYWYGLNIEEVTYTGNTLTIEAIEGRLHGKLISTETGTHVYLGDTVTWSVTWTTYTVADMHGTLTLDGMKVKLSDMSGTVTFAQWYQEISAPRQELA